MEAVLLAAESTPPLPRLAALAETIAQLFKELKEARDGDIDTSHETGQQIASRPGVHGVLLRRGDEEGLSPVHQDRRKLRGAAALRADAEGIRREAGGEPLRRVPRAAGAPRGPDPIGHRPFHPAPLPCKDRQAARPLEAQALSFPREAPAPGGRPGDARLPVPVGVPDEAVSPGGDRALCLLQRGPASRAECVQGMHDAPRIEPDPRDCRDRAREGQGPGSDGAHAHQPPPRERPLHPAGPA